MLIGKRWKIESDAMNVILQRRHTVRAKPGKPAHDAWTVEGYYATVKNALKGLVDQGVRDSDLTDLKAISKKQDELYELIDSIGGI